MKQKKNEVQKVRKRQRTFKAGTKLLHSTGFTLPVCRDAFKTEFSILLLHFATFWLVWFTPQDPSLTDPQPRTVYVEVHTKDTTADKNADTIFLLRPHMNKLP